VYLDALLDFGDRVLLILLSLALNSSPTICISQVAGIMDVYYLARVP
jgi:hypothetical protein